ncbi:AI-2E family transporter [Segnochrobactrum spirostomi]|uniref:AI-2E family transporter n=1 Tax=Segnochrobactrum spirostomi TaxID=2608987 RepID=A0A6A7XZP3_9HYPH|nr:AI-2E family transporter [Segnochrobactrum spirostomi]MQT11796.1 AI-2E family transporter [Segnochrobactrum spirostomi]
MRNDDQVTGGAGWTDSPRTDATGERPGTAPAKPSEGAAKPAPEGGGGTWHPVEVEGAGWRIAGATLATRKIRRPPIGGTSLSQAGILFLAGLALLAALGYARDLAVPIFAAFVIGLVLGPVNQALVRRRVPEPLAATIVVGGAIALLHLAIVMFALPMQSWIERAPEVWDALGKKLRLLQVAFGQIQDVSESIGRIGSDSKTREVVVKGPGLLGSFASLAPALVSEVVLFVGTLFFFLATRNSLRRSLLSLCLSRSARLTAARILLDSERALSHYFGTITIINVVLGVATGVAMWALGMPTPSLWAAFTAVANFAPFIGPAVTFAVLAGVGLVTFDGLLPSLVPALVYLVLMVIESQFVTPAVLGRRLVINPMLIFIGVSFWMWMWGPIGAFLGVPFLVIGSIALGRLAGWRDAR